MSLADDYDLSRGGIVSLADEEVKVMTGFPIYILSLLALEWDIPYMSLVLALNVLHQGFTYEGASVWWSRVMGKRISPSTVGNRIRSVCEKCPLVEEHEEAHADGPALLPGHLQRLGRVRSAVAKRYGNPRYGATDRMRRSHRRASSSQSPAEAMMMPQRSIAQLEEARLDALEDRSSRIERRLRRLEKASKRRRCSSQSPDTQPPRE